MKEEELIKRIASLPALYTVHSDFTKLPYVTLGAETMNDQAWLFSSEELANSFKWKREENMEKVSVQKLEKANMLPFFTVLDYIDVNSIVFVDKDGQNELELSAFIKPRDLSSLPPERQPVYNRSLQLSAIYLLQEMRRPVSMEEHGDIRALDEELGANLARSIFLLVSEIPEGTDPADNKALMFPCLQNAQKQLIQPIFSDSLEMQKFLNVKKLTRFKVLKVPFKDLGRFLVPKVSGMALNPLGINLLFSAEQLKPNK